MHAPLGFFSSLTIQIWHNSFEFWWSFLLMWVCLFFLHLIFLFDPFLVLFFGLPFFDKKNKFFFILFWKLLFYILFVSILNFRYFVAVVVEYNLDCLVKKKILSVLIFVVVISCLLLLLILCLYLSIFT